MTQPIKKLIELQQLSCYYERERLLHEVSFDINNGEIVCLLGPSGSGKTTLLRLIAGLDRDYTGKIVFRGLDIHPVPSYKRNFGMMFQEYALFPHLNVEQNVAFGLRNDRLNPGAHRKRAREMLELVGLDGFGKRLVDELSGGERQRVALARSLAPNPQLLLLDEPLGSLDRTLRDRLAGTIRDILKELGVTAIFVTHDQTEAFTVADRVAILHSGRLQQIGTPEEVYRTPINEIVARFLGFQNILCGEFLQHNIFSSISGQLPLSPQQPIQKEREKLLIRPEAATLLPAELRNSGENTLTGSVLSRSFQGSTYKMTVKIGTQIFLFDLPIDPPPPLIGDSIHLKITPSGIIPLRE